MARLKTLTWLAAWAAAMGLAAGCAGLGHQPEAEPRPGRVLAWPGLEPVERARLAEVLAQSRVVLVGEVHDDPAHHQVQLEVLRLMLAGGPPPVVGVEWLDHTAQPACDALSAGQVTVEEFARRVDWPHAWGYPLELYAPILEEVRARGLELVALNAPVEVVRQVARQGLGSLSPAERERIAPALDLEDPAYRELLERQFAGHGVEDPEAQDNFLAAQIARDETMAHHLAQALRPWPDGGRRGVVFAGGGHLAHGQGLPARIRRRLPGAEVLTFLPVSADKFKEGPEKRPPGAPADYLWVTQPPPPRPPRLGIMIHPTGGRGLQVAGVWPGGPAAGAGVRKGDVLLAVDGRPLASAKDIHDAIKAAPHQPHRYTVLRDGRELTLTITLPAGDR
jgi:uncharacterized iron-regulated protein